MNKHDIIQRWIEDKQAPDPILLGWINVEQFTTHEEWHKNQFLITHYHWKWVEITNPEGAVVFFGNINNQGHLRMLMEMLNINNDLQSTSTNS